ncbi:hypothetical protein Tco_0172451 [Tanacetum coccineum]
MEGFGKKNRDKRDRFSPYQEPNLGIFLSLTKSPMEILATEKRAKKPNRGGCKVRETVPLDKRNQERKGQANRHIARRMDNARRKSEASCGRKTRTDHHDRINKQSPQKK